MIPNRIRREVSGYTLETLYGVRNWLEGQVVNVARGEENMYQLQMAVLHYAFRRHRLTMIKMGIVLISINLFHRCVYKPFVGRVVVELFYQNNPDPKQGAYAIEGTKFEWLFEWHLTYRDHPAYHVMWNSRFWPSNILVWTGEVKER